jgi:hypothetical protein
LLINARMIAPKRAHADDRYIDDVVGTQRLSLTAGCPTAIVSAKRNPRLLGFLRRTHNYKRVFFRMAICPA